MCHDVCFITFFPSTFTCFSYEFLFVCPHVHVHVGGRALKEHTGLTTPTQVPQFGLSGCSQREEKRPSMLQSLDTYPLAFLGLSGGSSIWTSPPSTWPNATPLTTICGSPRTRWDQNSRRSHDYHMTIYCVLFLLCNVYLTLHVYAYMYVCILHC